MPGIIRRERPEICPVCKGRGVVRKAIGNEVKYDECHGCRGKGWVTVYEEVVYYPERKNKQMMRR